MLKVLFSDDLGNIGWKLLMVAEKGFRRLQGYELLPKVAKGIEFNDGIKVVKVSRSRAA